MTNNPYQIIEWLSSTTTLQPGDLITTGTPAGVAMGMALAQVAGLGRHRPQSR